MAKRVNQFGSRSVINIGHSESEYEAVTQMQKNIIFPILKKQLRGDEKFILDFGCGNGRFTRDLAILINGRAIGVDPIDTLLKMAPVNETIEYDVIKEGEIPIPDNHIDIVWICLILGGITDLNILFETINEINRILKKDGLLFLIENTTQKRSSAYWIFREISEYQKLFRHFVLLKHHDDYYDLDERISIISGRKFNV